MEILAPVGNKEALDAALRLKPDAVYFGLKEFNARLRTHNFTIDQVNCMVLMLRSAGIKSYITLNTLLKNEEFAKVSHILSALDKIKPDGIIVQDLGLADIISRYFPELDIFASTQTTNLNSAKIHFLEGLKIKRVILERQLTMQEIKQIMKNTRAEVEVFILGAVCYSLSGHCLFSSYIGGNSANRGLCTQPCRRLYRHKNRRDYIFSIKDLDLSGLINELKEAGIKGIKIEGRMKPGSYVYQAILHIQDALRGISKENDVISRPFTSLLMDRKENLYHPPVSGELAGHVNRASGANILLSLERELKERDIIRINDPDQDKSSVSLKIISARESGEGMQEIATNRPSNAQPGSAVFITARSFDLKDPMKNIRIERLNYPSPPRVSARNFRPKDIKNTMLYIIDDLRWLDLLAGRKVFYELDVKKASELGKPGTKDLFGVKMPDFIPEKDLPAIRAMIRNILSRYYKNLMVSDEGQLKLLFKNHGMAVFQDPAMKNLNPFTNAVYRTSGITFTSFFMEGDIRALTSMPRSVFVMLYGRPSLFASRIKPMHCGAGSFFNDTRDNREYTIEEKNGFFLTLPKRPYNALHIKEKLEKYGFSNFIYDLRYIKPDKNILLIMDGKKRENPCLFNLKKGLK